MLQVGEQRNTGQILTPIQLFGIHRDHTSSLASFQRTPHSIGCVAPYSLYSSSQNQANISAEGQAARHLQDAIEQTAYLEKRCIYAGPFGPRKSRQSTITTFSRLHRNLNCYNFVPGPFHRAQGYRKSSAQLN